MKTHKMLIMLALFFGLGISTVIFQACSDNTKKVEDKKISHYTCPMHRFIHEAHPGKCPICGMDLIPVYEGEAEQSNTSIITNERQQTLGITKMTLKNQDTVMTMKASGRVAFDPELSVAIQEYLEAKKLGGSLLDAAKTRLKLLGLGDDEIKKLNASSSKEFLLPQNKTWIYATLYQSEVVKEGTSVTVSDPSTDQKYSGIIRSLSPIIDATTRTIKARIEVAQTSLKPDTYVDVILEIPVTNVLLIPKKAVMDTGTRKVAFLVEGDNYFSPVEIQISGQTETELIVSSGLKEGDTIVSSSSFLIDAETQLQSGK